MLSDKTTGFRYFIELAFNGTSFHGWQIQPGAPTVQETLNKAISILTGEKINVVGCGRTDAGVHASHFVAHFEVVNQVADCNFLTTRLNRYLSGQIRIDRMVPVEMDFHARFQAISRTYHYLISPVKSPFLADFSWFLPIPLDCDKMNSACRYLIGKKDFTSFSKLHTDVKTNICEISEASWEEHLGLLIFRIRSDRFLRNMVRAIVGTLVEIGKGKSEPKEMERILLAFDRSQAGMSVPAQGLFLSAVEYDSPRFHAEPKPPFTNWF